MKLLTIILLLSLAACNRESSPDGRSQIRDEKLQTEIDSIKDQERAILDSIRIINKEIRELKKK